MNWKRIARRAGIGAGFFALAGLSYLVTLQLAGNFHTVIAGELYRSAQPSAKDIALYKEKYGIRSIVNLRGESTGADWYDAEVAQSERLGIQHVDFAMASSDHISLDKANRLVAILRDAPKPLLIHCHSGADRTGLASVIYLQQIAKVEEETAELQLTPLYGHLALPYLSSTFAMDESWEDLEETYVYGRTSATGVEQGS